MSRISSLARNILKYNLDFVFLDEEDLDKVLDGAVASPPQIIATAVNTETKEILCCLADGTMMSVDIKTIDHQTQMKLEFDKVKPIDWGLGVDLGWGSRDTTFLMMYAKVVDI